MWRLQANDTKHFFGDRKTQVVAPLDVFANSRKGVAKIPEGFYVHSGFVRLERAPLKIGAGNDEFISWRFAGVAHRPGVDEADLVCSTAANPQLRDCIVKAVANVDGILGTDLRETDQQHDRFVVHKTIHRFEGNATVPSTQHDRRGREIK